MNRTIIFATLLLAVLVLGGVWLRARQPSTLTGGETAAVEDWIYGIGYIEPATEVRRLAFKTGGVVGECRAEIGRAFRAGEVLMSLRNAAEQAAEQTARAELLLAEAEWNKVNSGVNPAELEAARQHIVQAEADYAFAHAQAQRQRTLREQAIVSVAEVDLADSIARQREAAVASAKAELDRLQRFVRAEDRALAEAKVRVAEARLEMAGRVVEESMLCAPGDGTVLEVLKHGGDAVSAATVEPTLLFGDISRLRVRAEMDESFAGLLRAGQLAEVRPGAERGEWRRGKVALEPV
jgi:HlyD family secretion protein